jgi:hypothetical protein
MQAAVRSKVSNTAPSSSAALHYPPYYEEVRKEKKRREKKRKRIGRQSGKKGPYFPQLRPKEICQKQPPNARYTAALISASFLRGAHYFTETKKDNPPPPS